MKRPGNVPSRSSSAVSFSLSKARSAVYPLPPPPPHSPLPSPPSLPPPLPPPPSLLSSPSPSPSPPPPRRRRVQAGRAATRIELARLVADEFEGGAVEAGDSELVAFGEVDLDHLDVVLLEFSDDGR